MASAVENQARDGSSPLSPANPADLRNLEPKGPPPGNGAVPADGPPPGMILPLPASSRPHGLKVGDCLGKLLLTDDVGAGATGRVFRALHQTLKIPVAVKILQSERLERDPRLYEQLKWEARMLAQINHPNIVRVWDFEDNAELPYIVLEIVEGLSLADLISQTGRLRLRRATEIVTQVAEGLGAIHRFGIIHRDIKPGNLLLTRDRVPKLVDLGIATVISPDRLQCAGLEGQQTAEVTGTPAYQAPEQFLAPATVDHRADIYALGATFYHAITGRFPFEGKSVQQVMLRKVQESPPPPHELVPGMNPSVSRVIARMMAKDPDERYQDHIELINALKEIETTTVSLAEILSAVKSASGATGGRPTPKRDQTVSEGPPPESPRQLARWLRDGVAAARSGDRLLARTLLQKAVKLDAKNENALLWLVSVLDGPQERIPYLDRIREFNPASENALIGLRTATLEAGVVEARKENRVEARRYLTRATELDPRSEPAWVWLARVADSPEEAANALRRALEINPSNEMVRLWLERCQAQLPSPASEPIQSVRTPPPSWSCPICQTQAPRAASPCPACGALLTVADLAVWRGQRSVDPAVLRQAVARLEILLRKKPGPSGHYHLALCYLNAKQFLQAARELQAFLRAGPSSPVLGQQAEELLRQLREAETARPTPPPSAAPDAPLGRTVLVVDDNATMRKVVVRALEPYDYRVVEAADGNEALGLIDELCPDVVLLDLDLPGQDGCQVCRAIRARPQAAALPIIMLSKRSGLMDKLRARLAGSTQYLAKPFQPEILVQVVENACPRA